VPGLRHVHSSMHYKQNTEVKSLYHAGTAWLSRFAPWQLSAHVQACLAFQILIVLCVSHSIRSYLQLRSGVKHTCCCSAI
jgi:hypothetical protein